MADLHERIRRIDAAVALVAAECGVPTRVVDYVWHNAAPSGEAVVRIGRFMSWRRPGQPNGTKAALRAGVIESPNAGTAFVGGGFPVALSWYATLTPLGRRVLWRITEETHGL